MDIYVDGSCLKVPKIPNKKKNKKKRVKIPGAGYAVVKDNAILIKKYSSPVNNTFMELCALIEGVKQAKAGDVVFTDQQDTLRILLAHGDPSQTTRQNCSKMFVLRKTLLRVLSRKGGITLAYYSSAETKKLPCGSVPRLADQFAGYASGHKTDHVMNYKGDREVITL